MVHHPIAPNHISALSVSAQITKCSAVQNESVLFLLAEVIQLDSQVTSLAPPARPLINLQTFLPLI